MYSPLKWGNERRSSWCSIASFQEHFCHRASKLSAISGATELVLTQKSVEGKLEGADLTQEGTSMYIGDKEHYHGQPARTSMAQTTFSVPTPH